MFGGPVKEHQRSAIDLMSPTQKARKHIPQPFYTADAANKSAGGKLGHVPFVPSKKSDQEKLDDFQRKYGFLHVRPEIVWMSPDEFLGHAMKMHGHAFDAYKTAKVQDSIQRKGFIDAEKLHDMPYLYFRDRPTRTTISDPVYKTGRGYEGGLYKHQGRHRMLAAKNLGISKVKVVVFHEI